jgi:hypothetical protein
MDGSSYDGEWR